MAQAHVDALEHRWKELEAAGHTAEQLGELAALLLQVPDEAPVPAVVEVDGDEKPRRLALVWASDVAWGRADVVDVDVKGAVRWGGKLHDDDEKRAAVDEALAVADAPRGSDATLAEIVEYLVSMGIDPEIAKLNPLEGIRSLADGSDAIRKLTSEATAAAAEAVRAVVEGR